MKSLSIYIFALFSNNPADFLSSVLCKTCRKFQLLWTKGFAQFNPLRYNGDFRLADAWQEDDGVRHVFKFKLEVLEGSEAPSSDMGDASSLRSPGRIIPSSVKLEVYRRDGGRCVICDAENELHFDHILPFSNGGTSLTADNVQLLCARHNLAKSARIE